MNRKLIYYREKVASLIDCAAMIRGVDGRGGKCEIVGDFCAKLNFHERD